MEIPADWYPVTLQFTLNNFGLVMLLVSAFFMLFHRIVTRGRVAEAEIVYRWLAVFAVGFTGFYTFAIEVFYPELSAATLGWQASQFQFEVGIADLSFGLLGLLSFKASYSFRLATVIGVTIWLWGCAAGHLEQVIVNQNYSMGNVGSWFWLDLFIPLLLIMCMNRLKPAN